MANYTDSNRDHGMQPLMEAGLDSVGAMELCDILGQRFGINFPVTSIFDHPTPAALVTHLSTILQPFSTKDGDNDNSKNIHANTLYSSFPLASTTFAPNEPKNAGAVHIIGISCRCSTPTGGNKGTVQTHESPPAIGSRICYG